jgi:putative membrane protein insertion efficiency factor
VMARLRRSLWAVGWPVRQALLGAVRGYRLTVGRILPGSCRFYPSCSAYAEAAIGELGAVRGAAHGVWRVLRCSPLSAGGVDHPPRRGMEELLYDGIIREAELPTAAPGECA